MEKKTGLIISIIVTVLALCCSIACCFLGVGQIATDGEMAWEIFGTWLSGAWGIPLVCAGVLVWTLPLVLWIITARANNNSEPDV